MKNSTAHEVLVKNARRALRNLSKDNSVSFTELTASMKNIKEYLEDLLWDVEEAIEDEWSDQVEVDDPKYAFDDGDY